MKYHTVVRLLLLSFLVLGATLLAPEQGATSPRRGAGGERVIFFVSDGMRHDLMEQFVADGDMPTYEEIQTTGATVEGGMVANVPSNSGPGWTALVTGAPPSVNGVTNNSFHDNTLPFGPFGVSAWSPGVNQAETIAEAAEAQGLSVMALGWQTFDAANITEGVVMDPYPDWLTGRGIVANFEVSGPWSHVVPTGPYLSNTQVTLEEADGWSNVPASYSPAMEAPLDMLSFATGETVSYYLYLFDSTDDSAVNYDSVLLSPSRDGAEQVAIVGAGEWSESIPAVVDEIEGGFYIKVLDLAPDLSQFRIYFTPVTRARAFPESVEEDIVARFEAIRPIDYSPYLAGLTDAETFVEQVLHGAELVGTQIFPYLIETYNPDLVLAGNESTDAIQHRFLSLALPDDPNYDPVNGPAYMSYIRESYAQADRIARALWDVMPGSHIFTASDHGFQSTSMAVNANLILENLGLYDPADRPGSQAVAYAAGGTAQIYINLEGRNPDGVVSPEDYEAMREQIAEGFNDLGPDVIRQVIMKEETAAVPTSDGGTWNMLHEDRTGDVVVFSKPPYQFDAATPGELTAEAPIFGQHGFLDVEGPGNASTFGAAGPLIVAGPVEGGVTTLDLAPTASAILGIAPPADAVGRVLPILQPPTAVTLDTLTTPTVSTPVWALLALTIPAGLALAWRRRAR